ncbi:LPXTG-motif cell wall anchor domain-containing protein [Arcanobacterium phocae]|uniref:LPXTG-motif cell wall anchor domain-containing protein n=1 Tax=Arcanobacterium phocae TaxID=131112 RepID=A0A1H2LCU6_9ACTO|nr:Ig-like domain-containing protein [Arcanobacterium phocae]SDU78662.1 LPXTG-motif cell wall anchor domain-containing protein [Arcanobacterium phocae]
MSQKNYKSATHKDFFISFLLTTSLIVILLLSFLPASSSAAEESDPQCHGSWNGLKWKDFPGSGAQNGVYSEKGRYADIEFEWKFNDPVKEGDALHTDLPAELQAATTNTVILRDSQGNHVATGTWSGNKFLITATDYATNHSNIAGTARLSITWNRNDDRVKTGGEFNLEFSGCGKEELKGNIAPDGPPGFHHDNGKQGEYRPQDSSIIWSIGVNGTGQQEKPFTVTDTAPAGWKFMCEPIPQNNTLPTYVKTLVNLPDNHPTHARQAIWMDHVVFLPSNTHFHNPYNAYQVWGEAGVISLPAAQTAMKNALLSKPVNTTSHYFADFNFHAYYREASFNDQNPAYTLSCEDNKITATFPYGISAKYDIIVQAKTVLKEVSKTPEPNSIVTNRVHINGKLYEGDVFIPGASGEGSGLLGGFTIGKRVTGIDSAKLADKEFEFTYQCTTSSTTNSGTVKVKANQYKHIKDVSKNSMCTVNENLDSAILNNSQPTVRWRIGREDVAAPQFTIPDSHNGQDYPAVQVTAINSYDNPPKPAPAKVEIRKEVIAPDSSAVSKADADGWTFTLTDGSYTKPITTKNSDIKNNKSVSASETVMFDVPISAPASVTITEDTAQKPDYSLKDISCSVTPKADPETITVTRLTDTSVSVAGIRAGDTVDCVATNEKKKPEPSTGSVSWSKVDDEDRTITLSNSEWMLNHIANGRTTKIALVSDCMEAPCLAGATDSSFVDTDPEPGKFRVSELPLGEYTLVEKTAPAGYYLSDKTYPFTIGEAPEQLNIALDPIPNTKITPPQLPLTGGTGTLPFVIGGLALIGFAGAIMLRQRLTIK